MRPKPVCNLLLLFLSLSHFATAQKSMFPIVTKTSKVSIIYDKNAPKLDSITAHLLAEDIQRVTSYKPAVITDMSKATGNIIVIGTATSPLIQRIAGKSALITS